MSDPNPYGSPPEPVASQPGPYPQPYGQPPGDARSLPRPTRAASDRAARPRTVTAAAVITIVTSALVLLAGLGFVVLGSIGSDAFYDSVRDGGRGAYDDFDNADLQALVLGISVLTFVAAVAVIVLLFVGGANDWFARRAPAQPWS